MEKYLELFHCPQFVLSLVSSPALLFFSFATAIWKVFGWMQNQSWLLITRFSLHPVKRKRAACLLQMMVIYGTGCLWLREKENTCPKQLSEQLVQVPLTSSLVYRNCRHGTWKVVLKITCVCIKSFYCKVTPCVLRSSRYQFGDLSSMLWPV